MVGFGVSSVAPQPAKSPADLNRTYGYDPHLLQHDLAFTPPSQRDKPGYTQAQWMIRRFKIGICAVPFVLALELIRWLLWLDPKSPSVAPIDPIIVAPVITCVVFVMSTVFSNVISDYKESEKIPAELVSYFQGLITFALSESRARGFDHRPMCLQIERMLLPLLATIDGSSLEGKDIYQQTSWDFSAASAEFLVLARRGAGHAHDHVELDGAEHHITEIKKKWTRIHDIGRLSIVLPAYTIMDTLCILLSAIVLCADYKSGVTPSSSLMSIFVFAYVTFYLNLMVRSLDDPFDGPQHYQFRSYCSSATPSMTLWETWCFPTAIDFECLTVDMGYNLRKLCRISPEQLAHEAVEEAHKFPAYT
jgi:hypothetical protein